MYKIGIDIGGTSLKCGIFTLDGVLVRKIAYKTPSGEGNIALVKSVEQIIISILNQCNISLNRVTYIGIGIPGIVDNYGNVSRAVNLGIDYISLKKDIQIVFPNKNIYVENDALVAGVAELCGGSLTGCKNGVLLTLGTGIGGAFIFNSKIYSSSYKINSEIGHSIIGENFYNCACGNNGCFETFCSATGIINYANYILDKRKTVLVDMINNDSLKKINAKMIFDGFLENDKTCVEVVDRFIKYLSIGIANLVNGFALEKISIGGGISYSFDLYKKRLKEAVDQKLLLKDFAPYEIVSATYLNDAGIIGASKLELL
ncbi:MAG: ROK family protein [Filifactoraceae bacterium]